MEETDNPQSVPLLLSMIKMVGNAGSITLCPTAGKLFYDNRFSLSLFFKDQYQFCYRAALEYLGSFDHYAT